ncbi:hypothetical protein BDV98DRAFT_576120 [Pterulicium gracile]|uniref:Uncharacterized protein n=1 Tax=Pterulicium gracile TaxID=1884261 RepID=A0A5C3Q368_9AGAR|nr:hypothetical protein BDV98DRAFT_576120 [Pterula gracilis]
MLLLLPISPILIPLRGRTPISSSMVLLSIRLLVLRLRWTPIHSLCLSTPIRRRLLPSPIRIRRRPRRRCVSPTPTILQRINTRTRLRVLTEIIIVVVWVCPDGTGWVGACVDPEIVVVGGVVLFDPAVWEGKVGGFGGVVHRALCV